MSEKIDRPKPGSLCRLLAVAKKRKYWSPGRTEWQRSQISIPDELVMYVGWRTVFDGKRIYLSDDEGYGFKPESHRVVWLFIVDERRNPIYAFPEDVIVAEVPVQYKIVRQREC